MQSAKTSVSFKTCRTRAGEMPHMADIAAAELFLVSSGRVLDRRRFECLFQGGEPRAVRDAVAAYRTSDGGFGHGLEPDGRDPATQPGAIEKALHTLHEADAWDEELVQSACDWLDRNAPEQGGVPFVMPTIESWPHPPWWTPEPGLPPSVIFTGLTAATLHARRVDHPWLTKATGLMWSLIDGLEKPHPYVVRAALRFLERVPDRERADAAFDRLAPFVHDLVTLDPDAGGEAHFPLDFAPLPDSPARRYFDDATIERHLDHFENAQHTDGYWDFNWGHWSPAAEADWRGMLTVDALVLLRANGRL
jgi:hypothetical protein